jgi:regulator of sigma E protease
VSFLIPLLIFILVLSFLIIIHELGHLFTAIWSGVKVYEFGLGYPPRAATLFFWRGVRFSLNWIPFGGFVHMAGEDGDETAEEPSKDKKKSAVVSNNGSAGGPLYTKSKAKRLLITFGGVLVNAVFGMLAFSIFFTLTGIPTLLPNVRIASIAEGSPAQAAGIPANFEIQEIVHGGGTSKIETVEQVQAIVQKSAGTPITLSLKGPCELETCQEGAQTITVTPRKPEEIPAGQGALGVRFLPVVVQRFYPWYEMPVRGTWVGLQQTFGMIQETFRALANIGTQIQQGQVPEDVAGPVGIFSMAKETGILNESVLSVLYFAGVISISLAIMNALPIPALDGGRGVMIIMEMIVGRRRVSRVEPYINLSGYVFLLGLMVLITLKDVYTLVVP